MTRNPLDIIYGIARPNGAVRRQINSEGGFILVITLLVTAILVAVLVEFVYNVYIATARAGNFSGGQRAALLAGNGVELAGAALDELVRVKPNFTTGEDGLIFTRKDGDTVIVIRVVDELSKVSTRVVYQNTGVDNDLVRGIYDRLVANLQLDERITETLADWIDADEEPRVYGAESPDHYQRQPKPVKPANAYLSSNEELLMVKGYTPEVYRSLSPFVTAFNKAGLVNINTARKEVIMALSDKVTPELAEEVMAFRAKTPFKDRSDLMNVPGFDTIGFELQDKIVVQSRIFRVYSRARAGDAARDVEAVIDTGAGVLYWRES